MTPYPDNLFRWSDAWKQVRWCVDLPYYEKQRQADVYNLSMRYREASDMERDKFAIEMACVVSEVFAENDIQIGSSC